MYPKILWDIGTAYDFFISLIIMHNPTDYGLRPAWAAGMRQRLPGRERDMLETFYTHLAISPPLKWIASLPEPKDGVVALKAAQDLSPLERMYALIGLSEEDPDVGEIIKRIMASGSWHEKDLEEVLSIYKDRYGKSKNVKQLKEKFDHWANVTEFGDPVWKALQTYYEVFFADEERRILPALQAGLAQAQKTAETKTFPELFEQISQGVRFHKERFLGVDQLTFVPSFWTSPFILYTSQKPLIFLFGARPEDASLVPGELVPDALTASLNALSDPTRLRILRYLSTDQLTPTQLATRLRLRTPTVLHHIKALRAAGLVYVIPGTQKREVYYQIRSERLNLVWDLLNQFVGNPESGDEIPARDA